MWSSPNATQEVGITPKFVLVPAALETTAEQITTSIGAVTTDSVNPFGARLSPVIEPRLADQLAWFVFADPQIYPALKFATLTGYSAPRLETDQEFNRLGTSYRVTWHSGAAAVDHRGAFKNVGDAPTP